MYYLNIISLKNCPYSEAANSLVKNNNIKSLLSYPSPWMVDSLLDLGFTSEKGLGTVFGPLPTIDITLVIKKF